MRLSLYLKKKASSGRTGSGGIRSSCVPWLPVKSQVQARLYLPVGGTEQSNTEDKTQLDGFGLCLLVQNLHW